MIITIIYCLALLVANCSMAVFIAFMMAYLSDRFEAA
jgi:hypothetical protein